MAIKIGEAVITLLTDTKKGVQDIQNLSGEVSKSAKNIENRFKSSFDYIRKALIASGIAYAVKKITDTILESIRYMDEMAKSAKRFGMSVEELSKLRYIASLTSVNITSLQTAFKILSEKVLEATTGTEEAKQVFQALGVQLYDNQGRIRNNYALFQELIGILHGVENSTLKTALAQELFGRGGQELLPLIAEGEEGFRRMAAEAERYGLVISSDVAKKMEAANDELTRFGSMVKTEIARGIGEVIIELAGGADSVDEFNLSVSNFLRDTTQGWAMMVGGIKEVIGFFGRLKNAMEVAHTDFLTLIQNPALSFFAILKNWGKEKIEVKNPLRIERTAEDIKNEEELKKYTEEMTQKEWERLGIVISKKEKEQEILKILQQKNEKEKEGLEKDITKQQLLQNITNLLQTHPRIYLENREQVNAILTSSTTNLEKQNAITQLFEKQKILQEEIAKLTSGQPDIAEQLRVQIEAIFSSTASWEEKLWQVNAALAEIRASQDTVIEGGKSFSQLIDEVKQKEAERANEIRKKTDEEREYWKTQGVQIQEQSKQMILSSTAEIFGVLSKNEKQRFLFSQMLAIAEMMMNSQLAVAKAAGQGGIYGFAIGLAIFAKLMAMLAAMKKIRAPEPPRYAGAAEGGIIFKPSIIAVAEKRPEVVIPLDKLSGMQKIDVTIDVKQERDIMRFLAINVKKIIREEKL